MGKRFNSDEMQKVFEILQESYDVYGPRIYQGTGCFSDTDVIRYGRLDSWEELVWDQKSDYSFKEALFPISETCRKRRCSCRTLPPCLCRGR